GARARGRGGEARCARAEHGADGRIELFEFGGKSKRLSDFPGCITKSLHGARGIACDEPIEPLLDLSGTEGAPLGRISAAWLEVLKECARLAGHKRFAGNEEGHAANLHVRGPQGLWPSLFYTQAGIFVAIYPVEGIILPSGDAPAVWHIAEVQSSTVPG